MSDSTLHEIRNSRQIEGEPRRRWFSSENYDLIVWFGADDEPLGYQLCYDKLHGERAITWRAASKRFSHMAVDDGESAGLDYKESPILVPDGEFPAGRVLQGFERESRELPAEISGLVLTHLRALKRRA